MSVAGLRRKPVLVIPLKGVRTHKTVLPVNVYVEMVPVQSRRFGACSQTKRRGCKAEYGILVTLKWGELDDLGGAYWSWCPNCWFRRRKRKGHPFPKLNTVQFAAVDTAVMEWGTARAMLSDWNQVDKT